MKWLHHHTFKRVIADTTAFEIAIGLAAANVVIDLINSFVTFVLIPLFDCFFQGRELSTLSTYITLFPQQTPVLLNYGSFLEHLIKFIIMAFVIYWTARIILKTKTSVKKTIPCQECAMQIPQKAIKCPYCHTLRKES